MFSVCPRHLLAEKARSAVGLHGVQLLAGFKIQFVLLGKGNEAWPSIDAVRGASTSSGMRGESLRFIENMVGAVEPCGTAVSQVHTGDEYQFEISLEPLGPVDAVDALFHAQEAIRHVSLSHGRKACFLPKPRHHMTKLNGLYTHLSISPSLGEDHFLAGICPSWIRCVLSVSPTSEAIIEWLMGLLGALSDGEPRTATYQSARSVRVIGSYALLMSPPTRTSFRRWCCRRARLGFRTVPSFDGRIASFLLNRLTRSSSQTMGLWKVFL